MKFFIHHKTFLFHVPYPCAMFPHFRGHLFIQCSNANVLIDEVKLVYNIHELNCQVNTCFWSFLKRCEFIEA